MARYDYAWEKLHVAVHSLAGWSDPYSRMHNAAISIHVLQSKDFPEELQSEWEKLWHDLNVVKAVADEGTIKATIDDLDEIKYRLLVEQIISLYDQICKQRIVLAQN